MDNKLLIRNLGETHTINGYVVDLKKHGFNVYFNKKEIDEKITNYTDKYIKIETKEEARLFSIFFDKLGFKWSSGNRFTNLCNFDKCPSSYSIIPSKGYFNSDGKCDVIMKDFIVKEQLYFSFTEDYSGAYIHDMFDNKVFKNNDCLFYSNPFLEEMKENSNLIIKELGRMKEMVIKEISSGERYKDFLEKINKPLAVNNF